MPLTDVQRETVLDILAHKRPYDTPSCRAFIVAYVLSLPDAWEDRYGNVHVTIGLASGEASRVLWSCHTDTVHRVGGYQGVYLDDTGIVSRGPKAADCLGADDGAGVFLMREMIHAKIPGHYVFHNGEEKGGIGSSALARYAEKEGTLSAFSYAIAFDRRGNGDVITHQAGGRCASRAFARSLCRVLNDGSDLHYTPSDRGIYTDTAEYAHLIPECTNISVGYRWEHTPDETLDLVHLGRLLDVLLSFDESKLVCKRDPTKDHEPAASYTRVSTTIGGKAFRFERKTTAESDLGYTTDRVIEVTLDDDGRPVDDDDDVDDGRWKYEDTAVYSLYSHGIRPRIVDGICELCKWPERLCQCTDEDRAFWRYLNGYK